MDLAMFVKETMAIFREVQKGSTTMKTAPCEIETSSVTMKTAPCEIETSKIEKLMHRAERQNDLYIEAVCQVALGIPFDLRNQYAKTYFRGMTVRAAHRRLTKVEV